MEMSREILETITSIVTAIIGLAVLSVLVSRNAATTQVISASSSGLAKDIEAAVSPVSGSGIGTLSLNTFGDSLGVY